ncbi:hypothetical protein HYX17_03160 [Candidatus Woesearchaeota archaeon]|nr:hypothetical protein [Candidatus Woesearchaeota archaeon]
MTLAIGYIFSGFIKFPFISNYESLRLSVYIAAPAVILHELMHKFVAIFLGLSATFHASYPGLVLGVILKLMGSPLLILVPGYVSIPFTNPVYGAIVAFAGPLINLILWGLAALVLKYNNKLSQRSMTILALTKRINIILFFFNMIPIGPFDGAKVLNGIISLF